MDQEKKWIKEIKRKANTEAANQLIAKYYKEIYAFVYKQTIDTELALDLTQEIFISVLKSIHQFEGRTATFRTWLYRIASNRVVDFYRSRHYKMRRISDTIEDMELHDSEDLVVSLEYKEEMERIASIINSLETSYQKVIRLKLFGEYRFHEIAEMEQLPLSTVKTRYYAALKLIKMEMKEFSHD
ncbi:RNA polymerase sigma factor [Ornithinibacillus californiensis]|uniref:RNA polymerase sigma factor n=1 Tax=Ornithinibacillus californiensis TaxID=161536 RepID=UPI00064DDCA7|nr:RNA polymerase sigma factor [Ornithinibacillus californiensis]